MTRATPIPETVTLHVPFRLVKRGGRKEMHLPEGAAHSRRTDNTLVKALARAFRWKRMLESAAIATIADLAAHEGIAPSYMTRILRLTLLAPDIVDTILEGRQGPDMTLARLMDRQLGSPANLCRGAVRGLRERQAEWVTNAEPLPFLYESTGQVTRFTNARDPNPRSREVFTFHRPETLKSWGQASKSLRAGIAELPSLNPDGLRDCQVKAITNLEASLKGDKPRALVQMATGSGKTFTAITQVYRLLKHAGARRILFLVDTKNLGEQAEQEFMAFIPNDDNRKFTELYNVQRLTSPSIANDSQVVISTIQRMYATLKGEELNEGAEDENPAEQKWRRKEPLPVVYNAKLPPEYFDVVVIDECHRSIYNLWRQVIEYFDAYLIGLTATPDNRTYGFFQKNVVSEYTHEKAVADKVNVGNEIYLIETKVTQGGETLKAEQLIEKRERETRARRWETQDEEEAYAATQLDRSVVNPDQIRTVIRTFHDKWPEIFPGRKELPKTLIFAKTDSHADDIIQTVRQEFGEGNDFCRKITNGAKNPKSSLWPSATTTTRASP
jgi:type I restriction enzyme R subunit